MMTMSRLSAIATVLILVMSVSGTADAATPTALVEDVEGSIPLQPLDYVSEGQVIDLGDGGRLSLGYLSSCVHEEIAGGQVTVGGGESRVERGSVKRVRVPCDGGRLVLAANLAVQSAATAVRAIDLNAGPEVDVHHTSPVITLPKTGRVVIKRVDVAGERHNVETGSGEAARTYIDLAQEGIELVPGGEYMVSVGGVAMIFRIASDAGHGDVPVLGRLVPF